MSRHDPVISIRQMKESAEEALGLIKGKSKEEVFSNRILQLALRKLLEILGEAANRLPAEDQDQYPEIEWGQIISMRNRLIHGYDEVDLDLLWEILEEDIPSLLDMLANGPHLGGKTKSNPPKDNQ